VSTPNAGVKLLVEIYYGRLYLTSQFKTFLLQGVPKCAAGETHNHTIYQHLNEHKILFRNDTYATEILDLYLQNAKSGGKTKNIFARESFCPPTVKIVAPL
jgi:hypothetical protein